MLLPPQPVSSCWSEHPFCTTWLLPQVVPIFLSHFEQFLCILGHPDQSNRFLSIVEHSRILASRFSILVFLDSERIFRFSPMLLVMFLPSSHRVELEVHCDDDRLNHLETTNHHQYVILSTRPDFC